MRLFLPALMAALFVFSGAGAGPIEDNVKKAIDHAAAGEAAKSAAAMQNAAADLRLKTPLSFATAVFVDKPGSNYGMYEPRPNNVFAKGEKIRVYAEPIGYGWKQESGVFRTHLVADVALLSTDGKVLWGKRGFGVFKLASRHRFMEYMMNLALSVSGLPAGQYVLEYTVTDQVRASNAKLTMPFSVQ